MRTVFLVVLAATAAFGPASCTSAPAPRTEVFVLVDAQPEVRARVTSVHVTVTAGTGSELTDVVLDQVVGSVADPVRFPVRVALVPRGGDTSRVYRVEAEAFDGAASLTVARATSGYVARRTLSLPLVLEDACVGVVCTDPSMACHVGSCQPIATVAPSTLATYEPSDSDGGAADGSDPAATPIAFGRYVKPSTPYANALFGRSVAISGDTIAVGVPYESSDVVGVDPPGRTGGGNYRSGAVYVFRYDGSTWNEEAFLKPSANSDPEDGFGSSVALDGDVLVVGAPFEDSGTTGVASAPSSDNSVLESGAVYVFRRTGATWAEEAYVKAPNPGAADGFGSAVAIAGDRLVVGAFSEDSSLVGVWLPGSPPPDDTATESGAVYVYTHGTSGWGFDAMLKSSNSEATDLFGASVDIDGTTIVVGAPGEDSSNITVFNELPVPADNAWPYAGAAFVFELDPNPAVRWVQSARLKSQHLSTADAFGGAVAISGDLVAVSSIGEDRVGYGVDPLVTLDADTDLGGVYTFVRTNGVWARDHYLKPPTPTSWDQFGATLSLDGNVLVVGSPYEDGTGRGVDPVANTTLDSMGEPADVRDVGAAFVYRRGTTTWSVAGYLKASNADPNDHFGIAAAVSGHRVVIGADWEQSQSPGNQADNTGSWNGAAYTYVVP